MINAQQIVIMTPLFNVNLPQNASVIFGWLMQVAAMEALPTDWIYSFIMDVEGKPVSDAFASLGIDHHLILNNFGTMGIVFAILPLVYLTIGIASYCKVACCRKCTKRMKKKLYWDVLLRSIIEGYVIGLICALVNMINLNLSRDTDHWTFINSVITLVIFPILIIFPFYSVYFLARNKPTLKTTKMHQKYGAMTEGYLMSENYVMLYWFLEYLRKMLLIFVTVMTNTHLWL